jgi:hypothetical protein
MGSTACVGCGGTTSSLLSSGEHCVPCWTRLTIEERAEFDPSWRGAPTGGRSVTAATPTQDEEENEMKITKNFQKQRHLCAASRCKDGSLWEVVGLCWDLEEGVWVPLCLRHKNAAYDEFKLYEVDGSCRPLAEELPGTEARAPYTPPAVESSRDVEPGEGAAIVPDELREEMAKEQVAAQETLEAARTLVITTQDDLAFVSDILLEVKRKSNQIDERLKTITKPLNEALANVRALFKPVRDFYAAAEADLKGRIAEAHSRQQENNAKALAESQAAGTPAGIVAALAKVQHVENVDGISTRTKWAFEITNPAEVPRELCEVSPKLIREYIKACGDTGPQPVAGVRFYQDTVVAARTNGGAGA